MLPDSNQNDRKPIKNGANAQAAGRIDEFTKSENLKNEIRKANASEAKDAVQKEEEPDKQEARFRENITRIQDQTNKVVNGLIREVKANKQLSEQISAFRSGKLGDNADPKLKELAVMFDGIKKYQTMVNNPSRYHNRTGYPYGRVNLLSSKQTNESVAAKRPLPAFLVDGMKARIQEEAEELGRLMAVNRVAPPYPHVEKRGKIVNELPQGMGNPNADLGKNGKKKTGENVNGGGRPSEADKDVHTTSWNREDKVNMHMSKADKAERKFQKGIEK